MKYFIFAFLGTFLTFANFDPEQPPQAKHPLRANCDDPCSTCEIYKKHAARLRGEVSQKEFSEFVEAERKRIAEECSGDSVIVDGAWEADDVLCKGKPCDSCSSLRAIVFTPSVGQWTFEAVELRKTSEGCDTLNSEKFREVTAPEIPYSKETRGVEFFVVLGDKESHLNSALPYNHQNLFGKWKMGEYDCEPVGCTSIDCFSCSTPGHDILSIQAKREGGCGKFMDFERELEIAMDQSCRWCFVVPSPTSEKVWRLCQDDEKPVEIPAMSALWFDSTFLADNLNTDISTMAPILRNLAIIATHDANFKLTKKPTAESLSAIVEGKVNGDKFTLGIGYPKGSDNAERFIPVALSKGSDKLNQRVLHLLTNDSRVDHLLNEWAEGNQPAVISAFLPKKWGQRKNPHACVNNASDEASFFTMLEMEVESNQPLDVLIKSGSDEISVWKHGSEEPVTLKTLAEYYRHPFLPFQSHLIIADPELQEVAQSPDAKKLVFFFKRKTDKLWSWVGDGGNSVNQFELLNESTPLLYTDQNLKSYTQALSNSPSETEKDFLLDRADKPNSFRFVDIFSSPYNRTALYVNTYEKVSDYQTVHLLKSDGIMVHSPIKIYTIGCNLESIKDCYNIPWKRQIVEKKLIGYSSGTNPELWLSPSNLGIFHAGYVDVHRPCKSFENIPWDCVQNKINSHILTITTATNRALMFSNWLVDEWDKNVWRANPSGYLARCD